MNHRPRKRFGQNFLQDDHVIKQILASIPLESCQQILEIGPGQGALTFPLLDKVGYLHAVEKDRDLIQKLRSEALAYGDLNLFEQDILHFQLSSLAITEPVTIVGNLPYNISTPLLFHLTKQQDHIKNMFFMLQKEVAERLCARSNSKQMGRLSMMMQADWHMEILFFIPPEAFQPMPKVTSAFVSFYPRSEPIAQMHREEFSQIVLSAFQSRRKTIRNALKQWLTEEDISASGTIPTARAEDLTLQQFAHLAKTLSEKKNQEGQE